jgi:hypothetical protein
VANDSVTIDRARLARLERAADKLDIIDCLTRFSRGMDRFDRALYLSAFHADAVVAAGPFVGDAAACYDWAMPMHDAGQIATQHNLLNHTIDIDGDVAHGETYYLFVARNRDETVWLAGGRYIDRLERRDGEWKIALRTNLIEWSCTPPALPPPFGDIADIAENGVSSRSKDDPSYRRPLVNRRKVQTPL